MRCLFEDRLANQSIALHNPLKRIAISEEKDLPGAFAEIAHAQQQGHWVGARPRLQLGPLARAGVAISGRRAGRPAAVDSLDICLAHHWPAHRLNA